MQQLLRARELGEQTWLPQNPYRWRVAMARVREAEETWPAPDLLDEAQRVYLGDFSPNVRPIPALRARVLAAQGRVADALAWAREQGLSATDDLSYLREFEHVTLARVLAAQSRAQRSAAPADDAARSAAPPPRQPKRGSGRAVSSRSWCRRRSPTRPVAIVLAALAALERALTLAEPEGYVRVVAGEGPPMASLLRRVARQRPSWDYVRRLLHAGGTQARLTAPCSASAWSSP